MRDVKLSNFQKDILSFFGSHDFGKNFYWTGGTLLSCQYFHHRHSVDLDFFSDDLYADDQYSIFISELKKETGADKISFSQEHNRRLFLIARKDESVKLELVFFPFSAIEARKKIKKFSIAIDSLTDIMVNKTLSAYQRNEPKDVYDLYYYLNHKPQYNLLKLIKLVEKKFGFAIEPALLLAKINQLAAELEQLRPLLINQEKNLAQKTKKFFQKIFNSFAKKYIK
ncbi:MAG: Uncharacterized protein Athens071412_553 [Parcubacteria group bacterium Athens0714_12]|nr:MAG: Uncharacterized protein Athens071412_553 [Parcubacteria group bacterium Athens0714_12]